MATGKVRIFELAKDLGLSSKDLIGLFAQLGLEAKNQLSVVDDNIAELVRGVLLGGAKAAPKAAPAAPAAPATPPKKAAPVRKIAKAVAPAPAAAPDEPVPTLKPVTTPVRRTAKAAPAAAQAVQAAPPAEEAPAEAAPPAAATAKPKPEDGSAPRKAPLKPAAERPAVPRARPEVAPAAPEVPIPQLRPVPAGRSTIAEPRPAPAAPPTTGVAASAAPGPATGIPGRPGVAPRPGQPGMPGQGYQPRPIAPGAVAPRPGLPGAPPRRAGNGPFRPLAPPAGGPRPFNPSPAPGAPGAQGPSPSSGGSRGRTGGRDREDAAAKKDREKEMLLDKERRRKKSGSLDSAPAVAPTVLETIEIPDVLTVQELATSMIVPAKDVIKELIKIGTMATINQNIPATVAQGVAKKFGFNAVIKEAGEEVVVEQEEDRPELMTTRPPVVTVLGHVDHGKTSLLDKIRAANVALGEAGGITQRIGAYTVERNDRKLTFIDTPGHEAFTAMRARGAKVTDVAILVVAADDGVMPQTIEAISHIRAANVPIVVAINKMDKEDAQPDRVKSQLSEQGLQPVDWGGKTEMVPVSARTGDGIDALLETVLLEADIRDLKANKNRRAQRRRHRIGSG